ncbi:leucine-rich repeat domain-containing protein [Mycoplasmopsis phocirhinis]|nr:leucine-rich repeat domain-containing protein [Mycoplasmopsis phocirhinis]
MKKNKLILLSSTLSLIPFVAVACNKKENVNDEKITSQPDQSIQSNQKSDFEIQKEKLQKIIENAQEKHKSYSSEEGNEAFTTSAQGIDEATKVFHEAKTVEELIQAGQKLNQVIEQSEKYNNLTIDEKRQLVKDRFNQQLNEAKKVLATLSKPDAIDLLQNTITESENIAETDLRYYNKLIKATANIKLIINNSLDLNNKTNKELYELYLNQESKIINNFEREFGNNEIYLNIQNKIRKLFSDEKNADKADYTEQTYQQKQMDLKQQLNKLLTEVKTTTLTKEVASSLYNSEITSLELLPEIRYIQQDAFKNYSDLQNVTFNDKLETIEQGAFANTKINSLNLPQSLRKIGGFDRTPIEELTLPQNTEVVEFAFNNANKLSQLTLNQNLQEISGFDGTAIKTLNLPNTLTKFYGFRHSLITELSLPATLTTFVTNLPHLTTLTIPQNFNLDLVSTNISSTSGIVISSELFPKLENIYVANEEQKTKLKSILSTNIVIENEDEIRAQISTLETSKNTRVRDLQQYISYLQDIAKIAIDNYPNIDMAAKQQLIELSQPEKNDNASVIQEVKNYLIDSKYAWTANKKLTNIDENIAGLKQIITLLNYNFDVEFIKNDTKLNSETRANFAAENQKYNDNKTNFDGIETKIQKLNDLIKKYREVVKNSEYYIQYLNLIAKHKIQLKLTSLTQEQKNNIKKLINFDDTNEDEFLNTLSKYIFTRKYNLHDSLLVTQSKIDELIALINVIEFELSDKNIRAQSEEDLPDEDQIKTDFELEKNKYENSKVNKWDEIIKLK